MASVSSSLPKERAEAEDANAQRASSEQLSSIVVPRRSERNNRKLESTPTPFTPRQQRAQGRALKRGIDTHNTPDISTFSPVSSGYPKKRRTGDNGTTSATNEEQVARSTEPSDSSERDGTVENVGGNSTDHEEPEIDSDHASMRLIEEARFYAASELNESGGEWEEEDVVAIKQEVKEEEQEGEQEQEQQPQQQQQQQQEQEEEETEETNETMVQEEAEEMDQKQAVENHMMNTAKIPVELEDEGEGVKWLVTLIPSVVDDANDGSAIGRDPSLVDVRGNADPKVDDHREPSVEKPSIDDDLFPFVKDERREEKWEMNFEAFFEWQRAQKDVNNVNKIDNELPKIEEIEAIGDDDQEERCQKTMEEDEQEVAAAGVDDDAQKDG